MDRQSIYTLSLFGEQDDRSFESSHRQTTELLTKFILEFHVENVFLYRDQLRENVLSKQFYADVDVAHLIAFDEDLAGRLSNEPGEIIPLVRINNTIPHHCTYRTNRVMPV